MTKLDLDLLYGAAQISQATVSGYLDSLVWPSACTPATVAQPFVSQSDVQTSGNHDEVLVSEPDLSSGYQPTIGQTFEGQSPTSYFDAQVSSGAHPHVQPRGFGLSASAGSQMSIPETAYGIDDGQMFATNSQMSLSRQLPHGSSSHYSGSPQRSLTFAQPPRSLSRKRSRTVSTSIDYGGQPQYSAHIATTITEVPYSMSSSPGMTQEAMVQTVTTPLARPQPGSLAYQLESQQQYVQQYQQQYHHQTLSPQSQYPPQQQQYYHQPRTIQERALPMLQTQFRTNESKAGFREEPASASSSSAGHVSVVGQMGMPMPAPRPRGPKLKFTSEDDALLRELKETKHLTWKQIADFFPGRSSGTLQVRYCTKLKAKTAAWTDDLVDKLKTAVADYDNDKWRVVSIKIGNGLSAAACRDKAAELDELAMLDPPQPIFDATNDDETQLYSASSSTGRRVSNEAIQTMSGDTTTTNTGAEAQGRMTQGRNKSDSTTK